MARSRLELHEILVGLLGSRNVYFQPPATIKMHYPCILYQLNDIPTTYADNMSYISRREYLITLIDEDPDSETVDKIMKLTYCRFDRWYAADNLNHWVFTLYF